MREFSEITWLCHICGRERPDERISVYQIDISAHFGVLPNHALHNVRYCNDNPACIAAAPTYRHFYVERQ